MDARRYFPDDAVVVADAFEVRARVRDLAIVYRFHVDFKWQI